MLISETVAAGKYYDAMKVCCDLIKVEAKLFKIGNPMADDDEE